MNRGADSTLARDPASVPNMGRGTMAEIPERARMRRLQF